MGKIKNWTKEEDDRLRENVNKYTNDELAELLNKHKSTVSTRINELGLFVDRNSRVYHKAFRHNVNSKGGRILLDDGESFGKLTILHLDKTSLIDSNGIYKPSFKWEYVCRCACGNTVNVTRQSLLNAGTISCGCAYADEGLRKKKHRYYYIERRDHVELLFEDIPEIVKFDTEDFFKVSQFSWRIDSKGYIVSTVPVRLKHLFNTIDIPMHRLVMEPSDDLVVDHKYGVIKDNRKEFLRICTRKENAENRVHNTELSGIHEKPNGKFVPYANVGEKSKHLGTYDTIEQAIEVRQKALDEYCGEFAPDIEMCRKQQKRYNKEVYWRRRQLLENERAKEHEKLEKEGRVLTAEEDVLLDYELCSNY